MRPTARRPSSRLSMIVVAMAALSVAALFGEGLTVPAAASPAGHAVAGEMTPSRERARMNARVFDAVWEAVRRQYYDSKLHGVDWRQARETYRSQAVSASDDRSLYRTLGTMLDLLDDDHAGAVSPAVARRQDTLRTRRAVMGISLSRQDGDLWRIESVRAGSPAQEAGIEPGWMLQTVDGLSWGVDFDVEDGRTIRLDMTDEAGQSASGLGDAARHGSRPGLHR